MIKSFNFLIAHIKKLKYLRYLQGGNFTLTICSYLHIWVIVVTLTSQKNISKTHKNTPKSTSKNHLSQPLQNHLNPLKKIRPKPSHITHKYLQHPPHKLKIFQNIPKTHTNTHTQKHTKTHTKIIITTPKTLIYYQTLSKTPIN